MSLERQEKTSWVVRPLVFFICLLLLAGCREGGGKDWSYKAPAGDEGPTLTDHIEFLEDRVQDRPRAYLEMAELAGYYLQRGKMTRSESDFAAAKTWIDRSLEQFESSAGLLVKADYLQAHHKFQEALQVVDKILQSEPANGAALITSVKILVSQGEGKEAARRIARLPESPLASLIFLKGQVAELNGKVEEARELYTRAIGQEASTGSASESARMRAVLARLELDEGNLEEAEGLLDAAHAIPTEQPLTELLRAELLAAQGREGEAESLLRAAFEGYQDPVFLVRLGELQRRSGKNEAAEKTLKAAVALLNSDPLGHERDLALALHYLDPGAHRARIEELMKAELERRRDPETLEVKQTVLP